MLFLLVCAILVLGLSLLTVWPVPVRVNWKFALLAGEYGHWLAALPLALIVIGWSVVESPDWSWLLTLLAGVALGCFLKPVIQARQIAGRLPEALTEAFGPVRLNASPFALRALFNRPKTTLQPATHEYAPGRQLDFYPAAGVGSAPCIVVIHGGGWDGGDRTEIAHFNAWLAHAGYAVAAIDYRLAPRHPWPAQHEDARLALAWLQANAPKLGFAADQLVLCGRSAGGQIAAAVGCTVPDPAIRGIISLYAPQDMPFSWSVSREDDALNSLQLMRQYLGGPPDENRRELYHSASAQLNVNATTPPMLLLHGTIDTLVWRRHSERMAARLHQAGRPCAFVELPWATHAFEYNLSGPGGQLTRFAVQWFVDAVTRR
jgi:acetyl esterase/lipase